MQKAENKEKKSSESAQDLLNTPATGLTATEVMRRRADGLGNEASQLSVKPIRKIIAEHVLTPFNLLNLILFLIIIFVSLKNPKYLLNGFFFGVALVNTAGGIIQELKARKEVLRLSIINQPYVYVIRDAEKEKISVSDLVVGDLIELYPQNQIAVDAIYLEGLNFQVDESHLSGESVPVFKAKGDPLLSGSFVISGKAKAIVEKTGTATYSAKLTAEASVIKKPDSEIKIALDQISRFLGIAIILIGTAMLISKFSARPFADYPNILTTTVAAMVGMIPEGLVLLNTVAFIVGVINLARHHILVQRMNTIETLARVDTMCMDKTGTITTGEMQVLGIHSDAPLTAEQESAIVTAFRALDDDNATSRAILKHYADLAEAQDFVVSEHYSFKSENKWAGVAFEKQGTWLFGAPEILLSARQLDAEQAYLAETTSRGIRLLCITFTPEKLPDKDTLPQQLQPIGFFEIEDTIRENAGQLFNYFAAQNVDVKIISGDNPLTVQGIARKAKISGLEKAVDLSSLEASGAAIDYAELVENYQLFGRVTPFQKKEIIRHLQMNNHVVAMTGDGINDVPAFKAADCSVAMVEGSDAARVSADLVLMKNDLSAMIPAVYEGRRIINNIERVACLFLTKTVYMSILAFIYIFMADNFPLFPIQMSLIGSGTIGIPGFFLSLIPNKNRVSGRFLEKTLGMAIPSGLTAVVAVMVHQLLARGFDIRQSQNNTIVLILLLTVSMIVLSRACMPFTKYRLAVWLFSFGIILFGFLVIPDLLFLERLSLASLKYVLCFVIGIVLLHYILYRLSQYVIDKFIVKKRI